MADSTIQQAKKFKTAFLQYIDNDKNNGGNIQTTYQEGIISEILTGNKYKVMIRDSEYIIPSREGLTLVVGNAVLIAIANGDFNKKWIDLKQPY